LTIKDCVGALFGAVACPKASADAANKTAAANRIRNASSVIRFFSHEVSSYHIAIQRELPYAYRKAWSTDANRTTRTEAPCHMIGNAITVARIVTGEEQEDYGADDGRYPAAKSLGQRGGKTLPACR
jgi:hypothetical protein